MKLDQRTYSHKRFNELVNDTVDQIHKLSSLKGSEYAGDDDSLANFRRNAQALGLPMESIWAIYCTKHWDAVIQYIQDKNSGIERTRMEPISGRVDDIIVYMILFKAMLDEGSCAEGESGQNTNQNSSGTGDPRMSLSLRDVAASYSSDGRPTRPGAPSTEGSIVE